MAIRKDLDDMLNNLKGNSPEKNTAENSKPVRHKSIYDNMSVDDLLNALTVEKKPSLAENILNELEEKENKALEEESAAAVQAVPEVPVPELKKKVVITGELPDYEELRRFEEKNKQHGYIRSEEEHTADKQEITPEPEVIPEPIITPEPENPVTAAEDVPDNGSLSEEPEVQPVEEPVQIDSEEESGRKKKSLFSKRRKKHSADKNISADSGSEEDEKSVENEDITPEATEESSPDEVAETDNGNTEQSYADEPEESATELIEAALAAINGVQNEDDDSEETDEGNAGQTVSEPDSSPETTGH